MSSSRIQTLNKYLKIPGQMSFPSRPQKHPDTCIYHKFCGNDLKETSLEHVYNSAWGGRVKVRWLICPNCNSNFSTTIDTGFEYLLSKIKNARAMITERNSEAPTLQTNEGITFEPYAIPVFPNKEPEGELIYSETVEFSPSLQYRSTAHTCLKVLGYFQPEIVRNDIFDQVKDFVYNDKGDFHDFAILTEEIEEFLPTRKQLFIQETNHVIIYFSKRLNKVIGIFRLLGVVKRSVILSDEWKSDEGILIATEDYRATPPKINNRYTAFVVDPGLPEFVTIIDKQIDADFYREEILDIQKYVFALGPTYWFSDYLKKLEQEDANLTREKLTEMQNYACAFIATLLGRIENENKTPKDVLTALGENGIGELIAGYVGNRIDSEFHKRLESIMKKATLSINPDIRFLE